MSDGKFNIWEGREITEEIAHDLSDLCELCMVAGSIRRGKAEVGDGEIVVLPKDAATLRARLDSWVIAGKVAKAYYSTGPRWGDKYRGLFHRGTKVEIFIADWDNFGYLLWLRTGPGEANKYVMQQCIYQNAPYRAEGGYWRQDGRKLSVPDEGEMFRLLGMSEIPPYARTMGMYQRWMSPAKWATDVTFAEADETPVQRALL